jgi:CheY-like chemotaxis protein
VAIKQNAVIIESKTSSPSDLNLTRQIISTSSDLIELISGVTNENLFNRELAVTNPVSTDLITCVDSAINGCVSRALEKNLSIFLITDPDIPRQLSFDGQWLSRIIRSLINNSISASNDGSEDITVSISSQPIMIDGENNGENEITIEITDGGTGMSKNTISTLSSADYNIASDQFQNAQIRLDPNSTHPRHFSIAIAKRILEEMDGSLTYTSAFDISTTATITIPMRAATDQETITRRTRSEAAKVSLAIGIYHPNNQSFAYSIQHKLKASYLNATIISNISKIKDNQYDVIFTLNASASLDLQKQISGKSKHIISIEHELNDDKLLNIKKQFPSISDCLPINSGIHRIYMAVKAMNTLSNNKNIIPIRDRVTTGINLPVINHAMSKINNLSEHNQGPLSGKSVLIVENREMIALAQKSLIENMGASSTICTRGEDAIRLAKTESYDAFVIEYNFYDCTGIELARSIRETENRNAKIICATSDEKAMQDSILLNVVDARLGKNIDPEKLSQLILLPRNPLGLQ